MANFIYDKGETMRMLIHGGAIFTDGNLFEHTNVRINQEGWISEVGAGLEPVNDELVINAEGLTLLPGLIDCHVHITFSGLPDPSGRVSMTAADAALIGARNAYETLLGGFTTVRSLGGLDNAEIALSRAQRAGIITGARIIPAGRVICMTGGHSHFWGREVDGPDEARKAAREQLKAGAEVIKLIATGGILTEGVDPGQAELTESEMRAAVQVAHRAGKKAVAHAQGADGIKNALEAGIDSIEHGIFLTEELIRHMVQHGTYLVPTLSAATKILEYGTAHGIPAYAVDKARRLASIRQSNIKNAIRSGVRIALGTDAGTPFNRHGDNFHELTLLVEYGLEPLQALNAATAQAADNIGLGNEIGRIQSGFRADLVLISGSMDEPFARFKERIVYILQQGKMVRGLDG